MFGQVLFQVIHANVPLLCSRMFIKTSEGPQVFDSQNLGDKFISVILQTAQKLFKETEHMSKTIFLNSVNLCVSVYGAHCWGSMC